MNKRIVFTLASVAAAVAIALGGLVIAQGIHGNGMGQQGHGMADRSMAAVHDMMMQQGRGR